MSHVHSAMDFYKSLLLLNMEHLTHACLSLFSLKQRTLSSRVEHVGNGESWSPACQTILKVLFSQWQETRSVTELLGRDQKRVFLGVFKRRGLTQGPSQRPFCLFSPARSWKAHGGVWGLISLSSWTPGPGYFPEAAPATTPPPAPSLC